MELHLLDDQQLVKVYLAGNEQALAELITRHKSRIYGYIFNLAKNRDLTEDIFQDTFIKVINTLKKGNYNEEGKFLPWVLRIAHNLVIDTFRKAKKIPISDGGSDFDIFDVVKSNEANIEEAMVTSQIQQDVRSLIKLLPEDQKTVLQMRHYGDMSFKDIAEELDISINTALGRMRYALINLRKLIEENKMSLTTY